MLHHPDEKGCEATRGLQWDTSTRFLTFCEEEPPVPSMLQAIQQVIARVAQLFPRDDPPLSEPWSSTYTC